ncbi:DUF4145 domain-containing protein [Nocardia sp. NPDC048505]|uniref:DUF4145 domain-containing protein n=1 Tax=unclassified Nocardia TaxID=2637762 RepID=UPI0033CC07C3
MTATRTCWHCGAFAQMERIADPWTVRRRDSDFDTVGVYKCAACGWGSTAVARGIPEDAEYFEALSLHWFPERAVGKEFRDVPLEIASAATEATECLSMKHYRAAVILARAVVEATAKDKGVHKGQISQKIDDLHAAGLIRDHTREAAHEIRFLANEMAHGDLRPRSTRLRPKTC